MQICIIGYFLFKYFKKLECTVVNGFGKNWHSKIFAFLFIMTNAVTIALLMSLFVIKGPVQDTTHSLTKEALVIAFDVGLEFTEQPLLVQLREGELSVSNSSDIIDPIQNLMINDLPSTLGCAEKDIKQYYQFACNVLILIESTSLVAAKGVLENEFSNADEEGDKNQRLSIEEISGSMAHHLSPFVYKNYIKPQITVAMMLTLISGIVVNLCVFGLWWLWAYMDKKRDQSKAA